jgi:hypothetical protein
MSDVPFAVDATRELDPGSEAPEETPAAPLDWWHRDHPTFTAITGFFTGLVLVTVLPGLFVAVMSKLFGERTAEEAFPFVLLFLALPIAMMAFPTTRRFGKYLLFGMVITLLVIFGVGTVVFWLMMTTST